MGLVLMVAGCGDDGSVVRATLANFDRATNAACMCAAELSDGMQTEAECLAISAAERPSETVITCLEEVYDGGSSADLAVAECQGAALADYASCLEGAGCDVVAIEACGEALDTADDACPEISASLEDELDGCFPVEEDDMAGV